MPPLSGPIHVVAIELVADAAGVEFDKDYYSHSDKTIPVLKQKNVSFSVLVKTIQPTLSREDYTQAEIDATWYNARDLRQLRFDREDVVRRMEAGKRINQNHESSRGLEGKTKEGRKRRHMQMDSAIHAVLMEQYYQREMGILNPELLAHIYQMQTRQSQALASARGLQDQKEVLPWSKKFFTRKS